MTSPKADGSGPKTFRELVGEGIGEASVCWTELPGGVFKSERASELVDEIVSAYDALAKDHAEDWMRIQDAERKLTTLIKAYDGLLAEFNLVAGERGALQAKLAAAEAEIDRMVKVMAENDYLKLNELMLKEAKINAVLVEALQSIRDDEKNLGRVGHMHPFAHNEAGRALDRAEEMSKCGTNGIKP